ncbi:MAG TPA: LemA family protein, partial [Microthrixaceae bacterium]|nr:LemA family protein [Microthrixaceae bacterium]
MWIVIIVVVVLVVVIGLLVVVALNKLRQQRVSVDEAFAGIDVQLTRRAELIPNLVETVKGYMGHERGTLEAVT